MFKGMAQVNHLAYLYVRVVYLVVSSYIANLYNVIYIMTFCGSDYCSTFN